MTEQPRSSRVPLAVALVVAGVIGVVIWQLSRGSAAQGGPEAPATGEVAGDPTALAPIHFSISPPLISNETAYPVTLYGAGFPDGVLELVLYEGAAPIPTTRIDDHHLGATIPAGVKVRTKRALGGLRPFLVDASGRRLPGESSLLVANDAAYRTPYVMEISPDDERVFVASPTTDEIWILDAIGATGAGEVEVLEVGDGPRGLARWDQPGGESWLLVVDRFGGGLHVLPMRETAKRKAEWRRLAIPRHAADLAVDSARGRAWVSSQLSESVTEVDLASGEVLGEVKTGLNPRSVALGRQGGLVVVGNMATGDVSLIDVAKRTERRVTPDQDTMIVGGHTEKYAHRKRIMGGKAPRDLVWSERLGVAFVSSIGPNIGPNADRMEVSMNGGVGVISHDLEGAEPRFVRHVSMLRGTPEGLALDDARGLLYVADIAAGRVVVFDAAKLVESHAASGQAMLAALPIQPPPGTRYLREADEYDTRGRNGLSLHSGTRDLRLSSDGTKLFALNRFTGTVSLIDVGAADAGQLTLVRTLKGPELKVQTLRRAGEVVYYTDLGNTRMTCDTCHLEGHVEGVLFTKGEPIRIYRSSSLRGIRETAPYFTPARFPSIPAMGRVVLGRNRYHNPDPNRAEITALTEYTEALAPLPNPYLADSRSGDGTLTLPDGARGDPLAGMALFAGKGGCAEASCHPAPMFTGDQDAETRGQLLNVGTPMALPIRLELQETEHTGLPPATLVGAWDTFPLLASGAGGLSVGSDGATLEPTHPFALRRVLELPGNEAHGGMAALTAAERNDLLAYLLTL